MTTRKQRRNKDEEEPPNDGDKCRLGHWASILKALGVIIPAVLTFWSHFT